MSLSEIHQTEYVCAVLQSWCLVSCIVSSVFTYCIISYCVDFVIPVCTVQFSRILCNWTVGASSCSIQIFHQIVWDTVCGWCYENSCITSFHHWLVGLSASRVLVFGYVCSKLICGRCLYKCIARTDTCKMTSSDILWDFHLYFDDYDVGLGLNVLRCWANIIIRDKL